MKSRNLIQKISILAGTVATALVLSTGAIAQHAGGGGHGFSGGGGGHAFSGGGGHAVAGGHAYGGGYGGGYRGGYGGYGYGGYHGGYGGWHGGYYGGYGGWRGGYWHGGWGGWGCCGWGWGWGGLGLGLYFATLPLYYQTYYWEGVPYYYSNDTYYVYDPNVKQYETVAPPAGLQAQVGGPTGSGEIIAYPKNGQSADQQSRDKFECHQWAASQSGVDPTSGTAVAPEKRNDYMRAQAACLEGRGYSVQ